MRKRTVVAVGFAALVALSVFAAGSALAAGTTDVEVSPNDQTVSIDETTTVDIVVTNADGGIGTYNFNLSLSDPSVASVTDISMKGNPIGGGSSNIATDGSSVSAQAGAADTTDQGEVTVATVTLETDSQGTTGLNLTVKELADESAKSYTVESVSDGTLTAQEEPVEVGLSPSSASAAADSTRDFDIVATNATRGIGSYNISVSVADGSVATVASATPNQVLDSNLTDTEISDDGTLATLYGGAVDLTGSEELTIATVTLNTEAVGSTNVSVTPNVLGDSSATRYSNLKALSDATLEVRSQPSEPLSDSFEGPSSDLNGDGVLEDVDGNGECGVNDVTALWSYRNSPQITEYEDLYDIDGDGSFTVNDVTQLWVLYRNGGC